MIVFCKKCGAAVSYFRGQKKPEYCSRLCEATADGKKLTSAEAAKLLEEYNRCHGTNYTYCQAEAKGII